MMASSLHWYKSMDLGVHHFLIDYFLNDQNHTARIVNIKM